MRVPELPVSIRVALWTTYAWRTGEPVADVLRRATPDLDEVTGELAWVGLMASVGERLLVAVLPSPGRTSGLPPCEPEVRAAVLEAGECVHAPTLGGVLVPDIVEYGPDGDRGCLARFTAYPSAPSAAHVVDALDAREADRRLRAAVAETTRDLDRVGGRPFGGDLRMGLAEALSGRWSLPPTLSERTREVVVRAATVERVASHGLAQAVDSLDVTTAAERLSVLRRLRDVAEDSLAEAAGAGCLELSR